MPVEIDRPDGAVDLVTAEKFALLKHSRTAPAIIGLAEKNACVSENATQGARPSAPKSK